MKMVPGHPGGLPGGRVDSQRTVRGCGAWCQQQRKWSVRTDGPIGRRKEEGKQTRATGRTRAKPFLSSAAPICSETRGERVTPPHRARHRQALAGRPGLRAGSRGTLRFPLRLQGTWWPQPLPSEPAQCHRRGRPRPGRAALKRGALGCRAPDTHRPRGHAARRKGLRQPRTGARAPESGCHRGGTLGGDREGGRARGGGGQGPQRILRSWTSSPTNAAAAQAPGLLQEVTLPAAPREVEDGSLQACAAERPTFFTALAPLTRHQPKDRTGRHPTCPPALHARPPSSSGRTPG